MSESQPQAPQGEFRPSDEFYLEGHRVEGVGFVASEVWNDAITIDVLKRDGNESEFLPVVPRSDWDDLKQQLAAVTSERCGASKK